MDAKMDIKSKHIAVIELLKAGKSEKDIIRDLKVGQMIVWQTNKHFEETGGTDDCHHSGQKRSVQTPAFVQWVKKRMDRNPKKKPNKIAREVQVGENTIRSTLKLDLDLKPFKKCHCQFLSDDAKAKRLTRSLLCRVSDPLYPLIIWSDEKFFNIEAAHNVQNNHVWCKDINNMSDHHKIVLRKRKPKGIMIWAAVASTGEKSPIFTIPVGLKISGALYLDLLQNKVLPWIQDTLGVLHTSFKKTECRPIPAMSSKIRAKTIFPHSERRRNGHHLLQI